MKRLRIAMISDHASPLAAIGGVDSGGQNIYVAESAKALARLGHSVDIYTRRDSPELPDISVLADRVRVIHVSAGPPRFIPKEKLLDIAPQFARQMAPRFRSSAYDVVHANFFISGLIAVHLKKLMNVPFAITFHALGLVRRQHQGDADEFPKIRPAVERMVAAEADTVIAECPQDAEDLEHLYDVPRHKQQYVPCGVDLTQMKRIEKLEARRHLKLPQGPMILQLGRLVPRKGIETVIRGLAKMKSDGIGATLVIVGGNTRDPDPIQTPEIDRLLSVANQLNVAERVQFTGSRDRDELKYFYSAADVFVSVPWYEPFGITPLEAMACECPVIGSEVGGIKHSVVDSVTGYLIPARNEVLLADRVAKIISDPDHARYLGKNGKDRVAREFTWETVGQKLETVLKEIGVPNIPHTRSVIRPQPSYLSNTVGEAVYL